MKLRETTLVTDNPGKFKGKPHRVLQNRDGLYKIQIDECNSGHWRDINWNDTAFIISGRCSCATRYFTTYAVVDEFIVKYWLAEPVEIKQCEESKIDQNWKDIGV